MAQCLLRLVEQPRILQRHADVCRDGGQQPFVIGAVHAFLLRALHADDAEARSAHGNRHAKVGQRPLADDPGAEFFASPVRFVVDDECFARLDDPTGKALAILERADFFAVLVGKVDDAGVGVVQRDVDDVGLEHGTHLLSDKVEQGSQFEFASQLLRHRVDGRELGRPLL